MPTDPLTPEEARMISQRLDILTRVAIDDSLPLAERAAAVVERLNILAASMEMEAQQ